MRLLRPALAELRRAREESYFWPFISSSLQIAAQKFQEILAAMASRPHSRPPSALKTIGNRSGCLGWRNLLPFRSKTEMSRLRST
ncbi:MAG: hypothetical protein DME33_01025 [Verrucomicrobia bacterium]|nr:MAG: hypothetical protein DME33_01025 [Verrucomicrobiota bacterium]